MLPESILLHFPLQTPLDNLPSVVARYALSHTLVAVAVPRLPFDFDSDGCVARYVEDEEARKVLVGVWRERGSPAVDIGHELEPDREPVF